MDSPFVRTIVATIGGYLFILLFLFVYDWFHEEYPSPPDRPAALERIQHPLHHQEAVRALQSFYRLPEPEKRRMIKALTANLIGLEQWLTTLGGSNFDLLCMGEFHTEATRHFLSEKVFPELGFDVLMLEATPGELKGLVRRMAAGRGYFPLLDADIMALLRTVKAKKPAVTIYGIEETENQAHPPDGHANPRDQSIAQNFWNAFRPGLRHMILFGALHCTDQPDWLFHTLGTQARASLKFKMLNVQVVGEHQTGPLEAFVYFLDEIGIEKRDFVIPHTPSLPDPIFRWFELLDRQIFSRYRSLVVFRSEPPARS